MKLISALIVLSCFSSSAFSGEKNLTPGSYHSENAFITGVKINSWADGYTVTGRINYIDRIWDNHYSYSFDALLLPNKKSYEGSGTFDIKFGRYLCTYPITLKIRASSTSEDEFFISYLAPSKTPSVMHGTKCPPKSWYNWDYEAKPYTKSE